MKDIRMDDIIGKMKERHPNLNEKKIREIIKEGCKNIVTQIKFGKDIQFKAKTNGIFVTIYKSDFSKQR